MGIEGVRHLDKEERVNVTTHGRRQHGGERMKKVIMAAAVLCLGLLLGAGSRSAPFIKTKAYNMLTFVDDRTEKNSNHFLPVEG